MPFICCLPTCYTFHLSKETELSGREVCCLKNTNVTSNLNTHIANFIRITVFLASVLIVKLPNYEANVLITVP
jgi:hypothetical protein